MARPRYQDGSLVVRGKKRKRYVLRWREDMVRPDRTIDRIQHAETIGFVSQLKRHEALEVLQSRVSSIGQQRRQPKVTMTLSEFVEDGMESQRGADAEEEQHAHLRLPTRKAHLPCPRLDAASRHQSGAD